MCCQNPRTQSTEVQKVVEHPRPRDVWSSHRCRRFVASGLQARGVSDHEHCSDQRGEIAGNDERTRSEAAPARKKPCIDSSSYPLQGFRIFQQDHGKDNFPKPGSRARADLSQNTGKKSLPGLEVDACVKSGCLPDGLGFCARARRLKGRLWCTA